MRSVPYVLLLATAAAAITPDASIRTTFRHENVLGTSCDITVRARSAEDAALAEAAALAEIDRLAQILSGYDAQSEFSRWARTQNTAVPISRELREVLALWDYWRGETGGALNPAVETAARLWRSGTVPSVARRQEAVREMAASHWTLAGSTATRHGQAPLLLNSFTKSWILSRAADAAMQTPIHGLVLNIGGDLVTRGAQPEDIAVANPRDHADNAAPLGTLRVANRAVATSGDYRRGFEIEGRHYSHILDPRTAEPAAGIMSATVISPDAVEAGALATAFNVLTPAESQRLAARHPQAEYLVIAANGQRYTSRGWPLLLAAQAPAAASAPAGAAAPADVQVAFELARVDAGRYRRPFVAVWIEDKDKFPVRTIALWYDRPRWLPDLKAWSRGDRLRSVAEGTEIAGTVASATRPPGKYTVKWDGKDQAGKPVKPGKYTIYVEAAREHGTYQLLRQEIDLAAPGHFTLTGGTEIAAASVEVKKLR